MQLTKNFTLEELTRSSKAKALRIDNSPNPEQLANLKALAENILQPLRDSLGFPINITSGLRVPALNAAVRGSKTSQHTKGEAVDIKVSGKNKVIFDWIVNNLDYDQIISEFPNESGEPSWVHVSYKKNEVNRNQKLKAVKQNGKTRYLKL
jgi:zinc D-Ala-D-Ala carboxypeptidase